jgi:hypothetical protein
MSALRSTIKLFAVTALLLAGPATAGGRILRSRLQASAPFRFEDLAVVRDAATPARASSLNLVSEFRLNRALPLAPRGRYEGEEEGGVRLFDAYILIAGRYYQEGSIETIGDRPGRHCYHDAAEVGAREYQPRIGELVNVSLVVRGRRVLTARARVRLRRPGTVVRERDGTQPGEPDLSYERDFGCRNGRAG